MKSGNTMQDHPAANPGIPVRRRFYGAALFAVILPVGLAAGVAFLTTLDTPASQADPAANTVKKALPGVSLPFIANSGQFDSQVAFYARTFAGTAFVTHSGDLVMSLPPPNKGASASVREGWTLVERPLNASSLHPAGSRMTSTNVSVFRGNNPNRWQQGGISTFQEVTLGEPWPGVNLAYRAYGDNVERIFTLAPGAHAGKIRMQLNGAKQLRLQGGELLAQTGLGVVRLSRPRAYQEIADVRHDVAVSYTLKGNVYGFRLGSHDPAQPVVIDPIIRTTYLGTPKYEDVFGIALGSDGSVYVTGLVWADGFPGVAGGAQPSYAGNQDAFISRLSPDLSQVLQSTYLGGSDSDLAFSIAISPYNGAIYVAGSTGSSDFPGTAGGAQSTYGGGNYDAFVAVLNPKLTRLIQSTYLGSSGTDGDWSLAISPDNGNIYIGGTTSSTDFPGTASSAQPTYGGGDKDAYIAVLTPRLRHLVRATYVGGSETDVGFGLAYAPDRSIYFVGGTSSTDFPGAAPTKNSPERGNTPEPVENAFVTRLTPDLKHFIHSLVVGGSGTDEAHTVLWAPGPGQGVIYIGGTTSSADFPDTAGGAQATYGGDPADAFVAVLGTQINDLVQATYIGGSSREDGRAALGFDPSTQTIYAGGMTRSTNLPATAGGAQPYCRDLQEAGQNCGKADAYIARLNASLTRFLQVTYIGGDQHEGGHALAISPLTGNIYMAYGVMSDDMLHTQGAAQQNFAGGARDVGIAILTPDLQSGSGN